MKTDHAKSQPILFICISIIIRQTIRINREFYKHSNKNIEIYADVDHKMLFNVDCMLIQWMRIIPFNSYLDLSIFLILILDREELTIFLFLFHSPNQSSE